jgi:hypothetical protein
MSTAIPYLLPIVPKYPGSAAILKGDNSRNKKMKTYAGHPMTNATTAKIVSPFPNPSALYIAGANKGNPKPAIDRKKEAAARAKWKYVR